jgi:putative glycosyltransferase
MNLSIVTTLYLSAPYLEEFYKRISSEAQKITDDYEIILVNDGSPDNSLEIAVSLFEQDEKVKVIDLSRNFGHYKAIMTGLSQAKGDLVFLIDCDLEEEPELLSSFYEIKKGSDSDVVYGIQRSRKGGVFERITGNLFYILFNFLSSYPIPSNIITARLMTRRYVASLVEHKDQEVFLDGLWAITGYKQVSALVNKHSKGKSAYNLRRKISIFVNSITSFSNKPLIFIFILGCAILLISGIPAFYLIIRTIFYGDLLAGWPSLIVSIWLLGGLITFCLGIIGIYLSKIFMETKQRPYTVIRETHERRADLV